MAQASPQQRRRLGLHFVPEERLGRGAVPPLSLAANTLLTRTEAVGPLGWLRVGTRALAGSVIERFRVKAGGAEAVARTLSGGNLQKFIVGREIDAAPKLLVISQPTWGVDVGAAAQIRQALWRCATRAARCWSSARSWTSSSSCVTGCTSSPKAGSRPRCPSRPPRAS